jgi:hypothetical protein
MPAPTPVVIVLIADTGGRFSVETAYDVGSAVTKALLGLTPRSRVPTCKVAPEDAG